MRVIAGTSKGRRLFTPKNNDIRPTPDKVKGALFNSLGYSIEGASFLDLFAGTGAIGIEALSRGAKKVHFVEKDTVAGDLIKRNIELCGFSLNQPEQNELSRGDALKLINVFDQKRELFDFIFLDPPYKTDLPEQIISLIGKHSILEQNGIVIVEHFFKKILPEEAGLVELLKQKRYGDTVLSYYALKANQ